MSYWGGTPGLPWFLCIIPILFFLGMMLMFFRFRHKWRFNDCCHREMSGVAEEVNRLRKELEEFKKK